MVTAGTLECIRLCGLRHRHRHLQVWLRSLACARGHQDEDSRYVSAQLMCAFKLLYPVSHMILFHTVGCAWLYGLLVCMPTPRRPSDCCYYVARIAEWHLCAGVCCLVKCVVMIGQRCLFFLFNVTTCGKSGVCSCCAPCCCASQLHDLALCVRVCRWPLGLDSVDTSA